MADRVPELSGNVGSTPEARLTARMACVVPSHSRIVRQLLPAIEAALAAGMTRAQIVEDLAATGAPMSVKLLSNYLARHRKAARATLACAGPVGLPTPPAARVVAPGAVALVASEAPPSALPEDTHQAIARIARQTHDLDALTRQHMASLKAQGRR